LHHDYNAASIIDILNDAVPNLNLLGPLSMYRLMLKYRCSEFNISFFTYTVDGHCISNYYNYYHSSKAVLSFM